MSGFLATLTPVPGAQIEAIYIAYYGRAADGGGYLYWQNDAASLIAGGLTTTQAAVNIADAFALQPESQANYSFLASPPATLNPNDPVQIASVDTFIEQVYANLFNRTVDGTDAGVQYWQGQILKGLVSVGSAVYDIANGATGNDATVLGFKVDAGLYFTTQTQAANIGSTAASVAANPVFIATATDVITPVVDQASEATSQGWTDAFVKSGGTVIPTIPVVTQTEFTLTAGPDSHTTSTAGFLFNAPLVASSTDFSGGSNVNLQTLTVGDTLIDTNGDGTLDAVFNQGPGNQSATGTEFVVPNVTLQGITTANLTVVAYGYPQGFQGSAGTSAAGTGITGLTTVNDSTSLAGIVLGGLGNGLNTALVNVNITGFSGGTGSLLFAEYLNPKAAAASNVINVSVAGLLGNTTAGQADSLFFGGAGNPGTSGAPNLSYGTWALTVNSSADLELWQNGVGAATALTLAGGSPVALGEDAVGNWQKLTTLDASASTGDVTITGHASEDVTNIGNLFLTAGATAGVGTGAAGNNPYGLFGSAAGLLDGNTAVTVYKLSTGVNFLDVSSFGQGALAKLVTTPGTNAQTDNEIVVAELGCHHDRGVDLRRHQGLPGSWRHRHQRHHQLRKPADRRSTRSSTRPPPRATWRSTTPRLKPWRCRSSSIPRTTATAMA